MKRAWDPACVLRAIHSLGTPREAEWVRDLLGDHAELFASAQHVADIALHAPRAARRLLADVRRVLACAQRDYDVVLSNRLHFVARTYGCVIIVAAVTMPLPAFRALAQFAASGGCLIFVEPAPSRGVSTEETEALLEMWPGLLDAKHVAMVANARQCLTVLNRWLPPDVWLDEPCDSLVYCHRKADGRDLYLFVNCGEGAVERTATLRGAAGVREVRLNLGGHEAMLLA